MKFPVLVISMFILASIISAQSQIFSSADIVINSKDFLKPERPVNLNWIPKELAYSHVEDTGDDLLLIKGYYSSGRKINVVALDFLNYELSDHDIEGLSEFPELEWISEEEFRFRISGKTFQYNYGFERFELTFDSPTNAKEHEYSPNDQYLAFVFNNNLYYQENDDDSIRITNQGSEFVTFGKTVSRNEFGIKKGIFWSPNSELIAFYKEDQSEVDDYPMLDISTKPARIKNIKYPMAGGNIGTVEIGIYNLETEETVYLNTSENFSDYLTSVTWSPDSRFIYVAHLNRDQNYLRLIKYNSVTGEPIQTLFEEQHDKYIEPHHSLTFIPSNPDQFLWISAKDGWNHIYLYDTMGRLVNQMTTGEWVVKDLIGFDRTGITFFFTGTFDGAIEQQLYMVNLMQPSMVKLTKEKGTHKITKHPDFDVFLDDYTKLESPGYVKIIDMKGNTVSVIIKPEDPYARYSRGDVKIFSIMGKDSTDLYCKMFYPVNFEEFNKYPAIVYVYGGPHSQLVTNSYPQGKYDIWAYRMAQEGYFVFTLDNRGTANRGAEFEQEIFRQLGTAELEDQMTGVEYLQSLSYIDENRLGVYGWSYGGFMSISMMTRTDDVFKTGVAGGPVIDWSMYEAMYTERYMDTPDSNMTGYSESNLLNYADNLTGKLLVVHGTIDSTVVLQHSLKYVEAAVQNGKQLDFYTYPGYGHHVKGVDAIHLYDMIISYFLENL